MVLPELIKPIFPVSNLEQVTDDQLARFAELIYEQTGIRVSPQKKTLLSNRVRRRLRKTGIDGFEAYYRHLRQLRPNDPEWDAFLQEITTHETYLFRDESQWDWFRNDFLAQCAADARSGRAARSLRIWSAACSTGDEAVTAACCIADALSNLPQWKIEILGTDIGIGALEQARSAVFGERAMRLVPPAYRRRFFNKAKDALVWQAKPILTDMIHFRQHNLMDPLREKTFDLVFLKNVLIYFDTDSKRTVLDNVRAAIQCGGVLVAGAAEGVADLIRDFQRVQPWLYRKPTK
ncbi:MAG: protein-glutamate O-methyltransferase CheR [Pirellulales bacterium]|nr:protein-glutamate O-methyltransferase CheR [Pirellulales bacterium]